MELKDYSITFVALFLFSATGSADESSGTISIAHVNGAYRADRGMCIQMTPALSGTGWACLYTNSYNYKEITTTLLMASATKTSCVVAWDSVDSDGNKIIKWITCA